MSRFFFSLLFIFLVFLPLPAIETGPDAASILMSMLFVLLS